MFPFSVILFVFTFIGIRIVCFLVVFLLRVCVCVAVPNVLYAAAVTVLMLVTFGSFVFSLKNESINQSNFVVLWNHLSHIAT